MSPTRSGPTNPSRCQERPEEQSVDMVREGADDLGVVAIGVRRLAAELGTTTVQVRSLLARLVRQGILVEIGPGVHALAGSPAAVPPDEPDPPAPRTPPHRALHDGTGSPLLW